MVNNDTHQVHFLKSRAHISRKNFGGSVARKRGESNFLRAFERVYFAQMKSGIATNEFALPNHGVADLVWVAWRNDQITDEFNAIAIEKILRRKKLIAFEAKLKDWQTALKQAFRYRYFADKSIVVMPEEGSKSAKRNISIFEELKVGLWVFDKQSARIRKCHTPVRARALDQDAKFKAISRMAENIRSSKIFEKL